MSTDQSPASVSGAQPDGVAREAVSEPTIL